jgi:TDG/mug DNA glycosylase family protein
MTDRKRHFAAVVDERTRVLVLGSLPGEASLAAAQYYAHPRNGFWPLMEGVIGRPLVALPYEARLEMLLQAHVGLWDVVASAERRGSLDMAIKAAEAADLNGLVATLPSLRALAFNGGTSAKIGRAELRPPPGVDLIDLPSSSPANTTPLAVKAESWSILRGYLSPHDDA